MNILSRDPIPKAPVVFELGEFRFPLAVYFEIRGVVAGHERIVVRGQLEPILANETVKPFQNGPDVYRPAGYGKIEPLPVLERNFRGSIRPFEIHPLRTRREQPVAFAFVRFLLVAIQRFAFASRDPLADLFLSASGSDELVVRFCDSPNTRHALDGPDKRRRAPNQRTQTLRGRVNDDVRVARSIRDDERNGA